MLTTIIEKHVLLEDRIAFLREKFEEALIAAAQKKPREPRVVAEDIFNRILDTDPSRKKIYTQWIIKQYLQDPMVLKEYTRNSRHL